jgi:hypothetical protein
MMLENPSHYILSFPSRRTEITFQNAQDRLAIMQILTEAQIRFKILSQDQLSIGLTAPNLMNRIKSILNSGHSAITDQLHADLRTSVKIMGF